MIEIGSNKIGIVLVGIFILFSTMVCGQSPTPTPELFDPQRIQAEFDFYHETIEEAALDILDWWEYAYWRTSGGMDRRNVSITILHRRGETIKAKLAFEGKTDHEEDWLTWVFTFDCYESDEGWFCRGPDENIKNPYFESGTGEISAWEKEIIFGSANLIWDSALSRSGEHSIAIQDFEIAKCDERISGCAQAEWVSAPIDIDEYQDYNVSVWYINTTKSSNVRIGFQIYHRRFNGFSTESPSLPPGIVRTTSSLIPVRSVYPDIEMVPTDEWTLHTITLTGGKIRNAFGLNYPNIGYVFDIRLFVEVDADDSGGVWFDDIKLETVP